MALFHNVVTASRLGQDKELVQLVGEHVAARSALFLEVEQMVSALNLLEFEVSTAPNVLPSLNSRERAASLSLMQQAQRRSVSQPSQASVSTVSVVNVVTNVQAYKSEFRSKLKSFLGERPRRQSVVGDNLPRYIRTQLGGKPKTNERDARSLERADARVVKRADATDLTAESASPSPVVQDKTEASETPRRDRVQNLLATSQSLYRNGSPAVSERIDSVSGTEREYILPNLFTKSMDEDHLRDMYDSSDEEEDADDEEAYLFTRAT